ncbi:MAG TPA: phosphoenolpyruvate carboxykinase domain-containing protein, partial [Prolixibacteraceae bacterium]|nr:phosphoenolpyruvate carboxykinase domain-containing protein [Prolixibacteraceae bacterium]
MLPFCGYNMGDYFGHWMHIGEVAPVKENLPKIFNVNWFRKDENGKWLWPGYGDNIRVLEWIFQRCDGKVGAVSTPVGMVPETKDIDISGLEEVAANLPELLRVDPAKWQDECELIEEHFAKFGDRLPEEMKNQFSLLKARLK